MIEPTWRPTAGVAWRSAGGPLAGVGTLDSMFAAFDRSDDVVLVDAGTAEVALARGNDRGIGGGNRRRSPTRGAVQLTGRQVASAVAAAAGALADVGVGRGDVVVWQLPNRWEAVVLYRACWRLGAVAAPLHHLAAAAEVAALVATIAPTAVVSDAGRPAMAVPGAIAVAALIGDGGGVHDDRARPDDVAVVLHTSGSTGTPKGVLHTHRSLVYKATLMVSVHGLHSGDCVLVPAPLAHVSGLLNGVLVPGSVPFRSVLMGRWSPEAALGLVATERVSFMVGPPTFFGDLEAADGFRPEAVSSLRLISAGGAGVTPAFVRRTSEAFGAVVKRSYGSTEAPTVTTAATDDDDETRAETDGRPVGAVQVRIVDPATGGDVAVGRRGEIWVSGPELFSGYTDPARTAEVTAGDWYRTGDLGVLDADGRLTVVGRLSDTIIRGGENISAAEVEAHLEAHPMVRHAVAVAEPDERLGERVCAFVEADAGFDLAACQAWFAERGVARYRTPERVVVVVTLPVLPSGKADRAALARRAASIAADA